MGGKLLFLIAGLCAAALLTVLVMEHRASPPPPSEDRESRVNLEQPQVEVTLPASPFPEAAIFGEVLDPEGKPVPGATVLGYELGRDLWPVEPDAPLTAGETDRAGRYWFSEVPPGRYLLVARVGTHRGYLPIVEVVATVEFVVPDRPTGRIRGRVVDSGGEPLPNAVILIAGDAFEAGPDGRFQRDGIPVGGWSVCALAPGTSLAVRQWIDVKAGALIEVPEFVLWPWGVVAEGRVLDRQGDPIAGARVTMSLGDSYTVVETITDASGRYQQYGSTDDRLRPSLQSVMAVGRGEAPRGAKLADIVLPDLTGIHGTFGDNPVTPDHLIISLKSMKSYREDWVNLDARLLAGGRFRIGGIEPGRYEIRLLPKHHLVVNLGEHDLTGGKPEDLGAVKFLPAGAVEGRLVQSEGRVMPDLELAELDMHVTPDAEGRFRFDHLPAGTWTLRPHDRQSGTTSLPVRVKSGKTTRVEFVLSR